MTGNTVKYVLQDPKRVFSMLGSKGFLNWLPDELYTKILFRLTMGAWPDLKNPRTFNEKIQWLKLNDHNPVYSTLVDKYAVKEYIADKIGEKYIIPLAGGPWYSADDIDFNSLPEQFVLKCNHDSGGMAICRDKSTFDPEAARELLRKHLKINYYYGGREWPYKNVRPCVFAEKYMQDGETENLSVYKILCFGGEPKIFQTIQNDKTSNESIDYFDTKWNLLDMRQSFPNSERPLDRPAAMEEMLYLAGKLSKGFPLLRTDFYSINGKVYFSELTLYSDRGLGVFDPPEWDEILGSWINLP